ncbi:MAG: response regulator transcription factor [Burkholderiaceae bacterium]
MLYIVDEEKAIRDSIHRLATSQAITATAYDSGEAFLAEVSRTRCLDPQGECLLLNIRTPIMSGTALLYAIVLRDLMQRFPVILMAGHDDIPMAVDMLKQGAFDFFEKPFNHNGLIERVKKALAVSREEQTLSEMNSRLAVLTVREREILDLILAGNINRTIGDKLGISTRTVEVHRANIFEKTQARNAMELARMFK